MRQLFNVLTFFSLLLIPMAGLSASFGPTGPLSSPGAENLGLAPMPATPKVCFQAGDELTGLEPAIARLDSPPGGDDPFGDFGELEDDFGSFDDEFSMDDEFDDVEGSESESNSASSETETSSGDGAELAMDNTFDESLDDEFGSFDDELSFEEDSFGEMDSSSEEDTSGESAKTDEPSLDGEDGGLDDFDDFDDFDDDFDDFDF